MWVEKEKYTLVQRGAGVVGIDPLGGYCPLYQREHHRQIVPRCRRVERFVSDESIHR